MSGFSAAQGARGAGGALSVIGLVMEGRAAKQQAEDEFEFFNKQASFARLVTEREQEVFQKKVDRTISRQKLVTAANGVDLQGSSLEFLDRTYADALGELEAIKAQGRFNVMLAESKAEHALQRGLQAKIQTTFAVAAEGAKTAAAAYGA